MSSEGFRFPIEWGQVRAFARSIGDEDARYDDPLTACVPPTFVKACAHFDPDSDLRPSPGEPWFGSGAGPGSAPPGGEGLHAEEHFEYFRPVLPGDVLVVTSRPGRTWEKVSRQSGRLCFSESCIEYRDEDGVLVVAERFVRVVRDAGTQ